MKLRFSKKKFNDETDYLYIRMVPLIFSTVPLAARDRPARVRGVMGLGGWVIRLGGDEGVIYPSKHGILRKIIFRTVKDRGTERPRAMREPRTA